MHTKNCSTSHRSRTSKFQHTARVLGRARCLRRNDAATRATPEQHDKKNTNGSRIRAALWRAVPFLHPWKCLVVRGRKRRCFARDMACPGKASIRAEYCANQTKKRIAVISTCMRSPPYIIIITIVITHNRGRATRAASPASARTRRTLRSLSCTTGASCISWVSVRHEDRTSGRTQWGWSGACPKRRAVQRRPPRTAP